MKKLIAALAMLALSACAVASLSPEPKRVMSAILDGDDKLLVVLTKDPCSITEIRDSFQDDIKSTAMEGRALDLVSGKVAKLCYIDGANPAIMNKVGTGAVDLYYLIDELGRQGPLQKERFKPGIPSENEIERSKIEKLDI